MSIDITLPDLGEGVESGDVLEVLVEVGDTISPDQGIVELETDKATMPVPSEHGGTVLKVHVEEGQTVKTGDLLVTLDAAAPAEAEPAPAEPAPAKPETPPAPAQEPAPEEPQEAIDESADEPEPVAEIKTTATAPTPTVEFPVKPAPIIASTPVAGSDIAAGPAIRRLMSQMGIDPTIVVGTGSGGRITREDVLNVVRQSNLGAAPASHAAPASPAEADEEASPAPAKPADKKSEKKSSPNLTSGSDKWGSVRIEKMSKIRRTIAEKMHESWSTVPRVTNFDDADVTDLEEFRQASKEDYNARGIRLTTMPFVIKAVAMALRNHPAINSTIDMEKGEITYKDYVNVGIAVDTDRGLVVPSLRDANALSIPDIAIALAQIAENARTGSFAVDDLRGSTFTISNLGAIGGTYSTPIINVPETSILLIGRSRKMPVVVGDEVTVRLMMPLSISYDHRIIDGATAARFLNEVIGYLKAPSRLLLAL